MNYDLNFGTGVINLEVDPGNLLGVIAPNQVDIGLTGVAEVQRALRHPIGSGLLGDIVKPGEKIVIVTSDITRPMPSQLVLPEIIAALEQAGVRPADLQIVFALGSHRKQHEAEKKYLVGNEIYDRFECVDSDPADCVNLGKTKMGTPVEIFRAVAEANRRICLGNIEYHYFAGYSGGAKAIMPGVSTRAAIQANHRNMVNAAAKAGEMLHNPVRQDIEEAVKFVPIDFILNVVLDEHKKIMKAVAGDYRLAHREGCAFLDSLYKVKLKRSADIVVVSAGGYPKDINLYQAQKALDNAKHAVREGGIIILAASCREGFGEPVFERWLRNAGAPHDLVAGIQRHFELGGHKAAAIALVLQKCTVFLVSDLPSNLAKKTFMQSYPDIQTAYEAALRKLGKDSKVLLMPYGGSTLPELE